MSRRMARANGEGHSDRNRVLLSIRGSAYPWHCANAWQKEAMPRDSNIGEVWATLVSVLSVFCSQYYI